MNSRIRLYLIFGLIALILPACTGATAGLSENLRVTKLITQGESVDSITEVRTVRHCGPIIEQKSVSCAAGTLNELGFSVQAGTGVSLGVEVNVEAGVSSTLGVNRESGKR